MPPTWHPYHAGAVVKLGMGFLSDQNSIDCLREELLLLMTKAG